MTIAIRTDGPIQPDVSEMPGTTDSTEINLCRVDDTLGHWHIVRLDRESGRWELTAVEEQSILRLFAGMQHGPNARDRVRALTMALKFCKAQKLVLPAYLSESLTGPLDKWFGYDEPSIDAAFDQRTHSRKGAALQKRIKEKQYQAWHRVAHRDPKNAIDKELFAKIGGVIGYGATRSESLYRGSAMFKLQKYLKAASARRKSHKEQ